jgi:hypothetical protein
MMGDDETSSIRYAEDGTLAALHKEVEELRKELAEEKEISSDGLLIAHLNGAASARAMIRDLKAERDSLAEQLAKTQFANAVTYGTSHPEMCKTEVDIPKEPLKAVKLDAERYRWLRDNWFYCGVGDAEIRQALCPEELDATLEYLMHEPSP